MTALEFLAKLTGVLDKMDPEQIADCEVYVNDEDGNGKCPCISIEHGNIYIYG